MKRKYLKILSLTGILVAALMFYNCEDFEDETFEMTELDAAAAAILAPRDSIATVIGTATFSRWMPGYNSTVALTKILRDVAFIDVNADTAGNLDTTYYFIFDTSVTVVDTLLYSISTGEDTMIIFDETIMVYDTLASPVDTVVFTKDLKFKADYDLRFIIARLADGKKDTVSSNDLDAILVYEDYVRTLTAKSRYLIPKDTICYDIKTLADSANTFLMFNGGGAGRATFYFTDYVRMNLLDVDGSSIDTVELGDDKIPLELSAGFYSSTGSSPKPIIKSRYAYDLDDRDYLLQLITFEQTLSNRFFAAILFE